MSWTLVKLAGLNLCGFHNCAECDQPVRLAEALSDLQALTLGSAEAVMCVSVCVGWGGGVSLPRGVCYNPSCTAPRVG